MNIELAIIYHQFLLASPQRAMEYTQERKYKNIHLSVSTLQMYLQAKSI
jgi:hypothetical protein